MMTRTAELSARVVKVTLPAPLPLALAVWPMPSEPEKVKTFADHGEPFVLPVRPRLNVWSVLGTAVHAYVFELLLITLDCASVYVSEPPVGLEMVCGESAEAARTTSALPDAEPVATPAMVS